MSHYDTPLFILQGLADDCERCRNHMQNWGMKTSDIDNIFLDFEIFHIFAVIDMTRMGTELGKVGNSAGFCSDRMYKFRRNPSWFTNHPDLLSNRAKYTKWVLPASAIYEKWIFEQIRQLQIEGNVQESDPMPISEETGSHLCPNCGCEVLMMYRETKIGKNCNYHRSPQYLAKGTFQDQIIEDTRRT